MSNTTEVKNSDEIKRHIEAKKKVERINKLVDRLADEVNTMTGTKPFETTFADALTSQHRTLQQSLVGALINSLSLYGRISKENGWYDGRNEDAVTYCNEKLEGVNFPFI